MIVIVASGQVSMLIFTHRFHFEKYNYSHYIHVSIDDLL